MINSIQHFIEKETYEIEKNARKFVEGTIDIDAYGKDLMERSLNLARNILVETLETMDLTIKNSAERREAYVVEQSRQAKELLLPLGSIRFNRTCYTSKTTGRSVYLLDEVIGLGSHQRITMGAAAAILEETIESSYRKGGERASLMDRVSKQTVKNLVHDTVIEIEICRSRPDVKTEGISYEWWKDHRPVKIPGGKAEKRETDRKEGGTGEGTEEGPGRKTVCTEASGNGSGTRGA